MVTGSPVEMAPAAAAAGVGGGSTNFEDFERDLEAMLREPHQSTRATAALDLERELNMYRSGSAPPTVEGSRAALGLLLGDEAAAGSHVSDDEYRSHPAYLSYYYSNEHHNPRLPPPMVSKEDWRAAQRFQGFGGIGDSRRRKDIWEEDGSGNVHSLFSQQPGVSESSQQNFSRQQSGEWGSNGLIGLSDVGLGSRRKSFADVMQEDLGPAASMNEHISRPSSRNAFHNFVDPMRISDSQPNQLQGGPDSLPSRSSTPNLARVQSLGSSMTHTFASVLNSPSRTATPDCQTIGRSPSPCLPPIRGRMSDTDKKTVVGPNGLGADAADIAAALSVLNLSNNIILERANQTHNQFQQEIANQPDMSNNLLSYNDLSKKNGVLNDLDLAKLAANGQINLAKQSSSSNLYNRAATVGLNNYSGSRGHYQTAELTGATANIYSGNQELPFNNHLDAGGFEALYQSRAGGQLGSNLHVPVEEELYAQYLQGALDQGALAAASRLDPSLRRNLIGASQMDFPAYQKAYLGALRAQQKLQYDLPLLSKSGALSQGIYGSSSYGLGMGFPSSPLSGPTLSSLSAVNAYNERLSRFPSMARNASGGLMGSWMPESGVMEEGFASSLLDEFKNNKTRLYELSDIVNHVVEFSADQFGSRFIQQKLETASVEEKNKIFPKILPHARALMTDVFGNYVIQKFFEYGTDIQRKELASELIGHVLPLSLQMYGCRVIQKALEVVDLDYQTQMVQELDGSVMKCVRDQNGNHVIQKCIECVPQEKIQFIISAFYGQVVPLSTHPYGCRVIQRVLEHCDDPKTQSIMMEEILQSVCTLAQDQYGNYVVQHVLQHGKPEERAHIISKLAGQIVKMSQQKFASNVVEKCLTYSTAEERQVLIDEMLGSTDENEPLQAMMKDQFGNYVVQKVLETCDDQNRELILSRVKVHLNALKKYTYGKHIVARVEKLIATGERQGGISSY